MKNPPRVYFYCCDDPGNLQEDVISLAEGFRELGVPFSGNCNYWLQSTQPDDYLIRHDAAVSPQDCDIVVVSYTWPFWVRMQTFDVVRRPLPERLFAPGRKYAIVFMDNHDSHRTISWEPEYRQFDAIFRTKLNRRIWHPENMRPWAYGLNNRIIQATAGAPAFADKRRSLLVNFGASHPTRHGARELARTKFEPRVEKIIPIERAKDDLSVPPQDDYAALMWKQTGARFNRNYYERLKQSQAVACFCGDIIPPMPFRNPEQYLVGGNRAKIRRALFDILALFDNRAPRSVGWDSFRFWETMAAGTAAVNIDLDHYGVVLPVMPENGAHYLGVDFARVDEFVERLCGESALLESVAKQGREWAATHYSPKAVATRFLDSLGYKLH